MVRKNNDSQTFKQFSSMMIFVVIAALFWLLIKLSSNYTVTEPLTINIKDTPADLVLTNGTQKIKVTLSTSGFELLNYYFKPISRRKVDISLEEVPLHKDSESTYSFSSSYAKEKIANFLLLRSQKAGGERTLQITMEVLASLIGETRIRVSNLLNELQEKNLLSLKRKEIYIPSLEKLLAELQQPSEEDQ